MIPLATLQNAALAGDKEAAAQLARFESRYLDYMDERRQWDAAMHSESSNNGRNPMFEAKQNGLVNGSEIRASERWKRTGPPVKRNGRQIVVDPALLEDCDTDVAILAAQIGGSQWTEIPSAERESRKRTPVRVDTEAARHKAAVQAIVAKLDNAEQRRAVAEGIA